ncbi:MULTISPECIES: NAD(P)-dependent oxidoreductase [Microbacterium]|uniref:NAD-dependent epimerase/dehydratase family protein n=1 Tax=Microbacterium TaxID=33882 RepID=UPI0027824A97|nr:MULTISPECIES: SDR family NAD(P)-dependent oxidoreductase [Microbacterium]MDQ1083266.1 dTDP-L-rhamnose 4-epimerase [Microbacterium sp. SORGH_AS_0344]MDQ1171456.1 dTDP-L-rhamnose 4-epimerase [Microbacterium proteolyticum]
MPRHVLITGGAGFIGSRLAARFVAEGHRVRVLDALLPQVHGADPTQTSPTLRSVAEVAEVQQGTVTSTEDLRAALRDVDIVVHLAAETGTGQSMYEIDRYVEVNIGGTAKLMDLLTNESHGVERVVVASSRSIYGEGKYRSASGQTVFPPHRSDAAMASGDFAIRGADGEELEMVPTPEDALLHPSSVYGITKHVQESLVMTVAPTIDVEPVSLRYQNVYGPGQSLSNPYTGILSIFSTLIRQGKAIDIFEDGEESRDFVYIDDVVEATMIAALEPAAAGGIFNVGSGQATTVLEVVDALATAFDAKVEVSVSGRYRLGDIRHNVADTSRLRDVLGFQPSVPFAEGVRRFVEWVVEEPVGGGEYERSLEEMAARRLLK